MNPAEVLTDDQIAVLGCLAALTVSGLIAAVSYHLGPAGSADRRARRTAGRIGTEPVSAPAEDQRRAA